MIRSLLWRLLATMFAVLVAWLVVASQNLFMADSEGGWEANWMPVVAVGAPGPTAYTVPAHALRVEDVAEATVDSPLGAASVRLPEVVRVGDRAEIWISGTEMVRVRPLAPRNRLVDAGIISALIMSLGVVLVLTWRNARFRS